VARVHLGRSVLALAVLALACGGILLFRLTAPRPGGLRLIDLLGEARLEAEREFPRPEDPRRLSRDVTLAGETFDSITPPFPSRLDFTIRIPSSSTLEVSTALVMTEDVSRARVRFAVAIETREERATVFEQVRTRNDANRWEASSIDLSRWAGQEAVLVLISSPVPEREEVLWANRVLVAWGDPVLRDAREARSTLAQAERWLRDRLPLRDKLSTEDALSAEFTFNLLLAGLLSLCLPVFHLLEPEAHRERLPPGLTLFTLAATLVVAIVHSSVALSLGLLGALSILRFRTPIPSGEHLLYLLLCLAIAVPLGVNRPLLGIAAAATAMLTAAATRSVARPKLRRFLLTASGKIESGSAVSIADAFGSLSDAVEIEGLEVHGGRFTMSARVTLEGSRRTLAALSAMRGWVDELRVSLQALETRGSGW
jgi:hypothetical protein